MMKRYESDEERCEKGYACSNCADRREKERERDERMEPDALVHEMTLKIVEVVDTKWQTRVEKAEALAMFIVEAIRMARTHHEAEHHGYKD